MEITNKFVEPIKNLVENFDIDILKPKNYS